MLKPSTFNTTLYPFSLFSCYVSAALIFPFSHTLDPYAMIGISLMCMGFVSFSLYKSSNSTRFQYFYVSMSILLGCVIYCLTSLLFNLMGLPQWYGLAGLATTHLPTNLLQDLSVWLSLALFSGLTYFLVMTWIGDHIRYQIKNSQKKIKPQRLAAFLEAMTLTFPVVAGLSILLYAADVFSSSPLDLLSIFMLPTSLRLTELKCYVMLFLWGLLSFLYYTYGFPQETLHELEHLQSIPKHVEEWRLASEGRMFIGSEHLSDSLTSHTSHP